MRLRIRRFVLIAALLLGGCASAPALPTVDAHIISRVVPMYAPHRDDAIALVLPDPASAEDQALMALLADELPRNGLHPVDVPENARWVLQGRYLLLARPTATAESAPDAEPQLVEERQADLRLTLYSVTEFINGERSAVWTSTSYGNPELYLHHPRTLMRLLLQHFGSDFAGDLRTVDLDRHGADAH